MTGLLNAQVDALRTAIPFEISGRVSAVSGLTIEVAGLTVPVGATCEVIVPHGAPVVCDVVGFRDETTVLMPLSATGGVAKGQRVRCVTAAQRVGVGPALLGRVIDGLGRPLDDAGPIAADDQYPLFCAAPDAMRRAAIVAPMSVGIRSINAMLTPGRGQRLGVFAGTGVGKSVLLGMMSRFTSADVTVIALIGERGREVGDFLNKELDAASRRKSVVVVSTSDQSPVVRVRACFTATAVAEYFRDQGADVLLLMDSVTRMAMAQRQIGLAAGEPPTTKGYTPSVFSLLPQLLERGGRTKDGSITGLYTVLVEGDDMNEPIADAVRGILDGHVILSRKLAMRGHYPSVAVLESVSRIMPDVVPPEHLAAAQQVRRMMAIWEDIADLVNIGAYAAGTNAEYDLAIKARPWIEAFLQQGVKDRFDFAQSSAALVGLAQQIAQADSAARASDPRGKAGK